MVCHFYLYCNLYLYLYVFVFVFVTSGLRTCIGILKLKSRVEVRSLQQSWSHFTAIIIMVATSKMLVTPCWVKEGGKVNSPCSWQLLLSKITPFCLRVLLLMWWICLVECRMCSIRLVSTSKLMEWRHRCSFFLSEFPQKSWFKLKAPGFESALFQAPLHWHHCLEDWSSTVGNWPFSTVFVFSKRQLESAPLWK